MVLEMDTHLEETLNPGVDGTAPSARKPSKRLSTASSSWGTYATALRGRFSTGMFNPSRNSITDNAYKALYEEFEREIQVRRRTTTRRACVSAAAPGAEHDARADGSKPPLGGVNGRLGPARIRQRRQRQDAQSGYGHGGRSLDRNIQLA